VDFPWPPGASTGIGSLPGADVLEAVKTVLGESPDLPYLPELPARGPGSDMIGRAAGLLVDMPVELYASQWRIASHSGRDMRRTHDLWERDLDALTDLVSEFDGLVKTQVAGPWTLAASVDLPVGGRMLRDAGAVRDLTASLAEGVGAHLADLHKRLPRARLLLQIDEPSLPAVLAGRVPTESGYGTLRAVEEATAISALRDVVAVGLHVSADASADDRGWRAGTVIHCCAAEPPIGLLREAGAVAVALDLDLALNQAKDYDALGEALDGGVGLFAGAVPTTDGSATSAQVEERLRDLWRQIGFSANSLAAQVVVTPACGLASATPAAARRAVTLAREAGRRLADS
jgi:methionine synthase II (cobalamin-independent)